MRRRAARLILRGSSAAGRDPLPLPASVFMRGMRVLPAACSTPSRARRPAFRRGMAEVGGAMSERERYSSRTSWTRRRLSPRVRSAGFLRHRYDATDGRAISSHHAPTPDGAGHPEHREGARGARRDARRRRAHADVRHRHRALAGVRARPRRDLRRDPPLHDDGRGEPADRRPDAHRDRGGRRDHMNLRRARPAGERSGSAAGPWVAALGWRSPSSGPESGRARAAARRALLQRGVTTHIGRGSPPQSSRPLLNREWLLILLLQGWLSGWRARAGLAALPGSSGWRGGGLLFLSSGGQLPAPAAGREPRPREARGERRGVGGDQPRAGRRRHRNYGKPRGAGAAEGSRLRGAGATHE